ncbi:MULTISPECIES: helix-turn-helix domain-containing protein [unclassified Lentimicrobium]|uniref:helix-turn-helix domain-containing protein n=1 Tax=unclassified Lentimicrobium TaxID=2677434 RepID=UPI001554AE1A|nr:MULTISPECIES: helix-turn-helix domain-containing protein [unclassified Lentimicrobium]NPD45174.1 helix-turn-helix domain-containing protein [Lentimicrobium sp. S6]NPD84492.1 helix-turn-helix domain-containing protein [Lentimicrobium sp. L6]
MPNQELIDKLKQIILKHISNEKFGVAELAEESGMSRSTLLRKMQKDTGLSASQFIKKVRLEESKTLLDETDLSISEISFKVGFNSISYYIKCFKEEYELSPGEYLKKEKTAGEQIEIEKVHVNRKPYVWLIPLSVIIIGLSIWVGTIFSEEGKPIDKSIAVLPFKNDSKDSSNVYIVNGLMDAILNNLQKVKDLRVISRTSVEKYRNSNKTIAEIAEELGVSYFVEGSGQKVGDQILLNIQLIEAQRDKHIWAEQYDRKLNDIFEIQKEVASKIVQQVEVKITPAEMERIEEIPTDNIVAYDFFLQGLELLYNPTGTSLDSAIVFFSLAIEQDKDFARAYAATAMAYYYLDIFQVQKQYIEKTEFYAEKAYLLDPQSPQSLVAKAFSYMTKKEYEIAVSYFEKALEYHPNSAFVLNFLSDFYTNYIPNTEKYLEFALKGLQVDKSSNDSSASSYLYLHLSNAFIQAGFIEEALKYSNQSLAYYPQNIYSHYLKVYIEYAEHRNMEITNDKLLEVYNMDTTRLDVIQEVAKSYYILGNYKMAYHFYNKLIVAKEKYDIYLFVHENIKIAWTCKELGYEQEEHDLLEEYRVYSENDQSIYQPLLMCGYYAYINDTEKAMDNLRLFSNSDNYHLWTLFLINERHLESISSSPEFIEILEGLEKRFWERHEVLSTKLESEGLIKKRF